MKKILLLIIGFGILSFTLYKQSDFSELIQNKLDNYTRKNYPEKAYVQTDKPFYALDEDLWFTAYLVNGITHQRTEKSRVLYVDLINEQDSIVAQQTLYVKNIGVAGDFKINKDWKAGDYKLRAYTHYMKNNTSSLFFKKKIPIYNVDKKTAPKKDTNVELTNNINNNKIIKPDLKFYPEGGYLIEEMSNRVTFKIKSEQYTEINFTGTIKDQNNHEILQFKSLKFGLGAFVFTPKKDNRYYASIYINNKEERYELPKALSTGHTLNSTNSGKFITVNVASNLKNGLAGTFLVIHQKGELLYKKYETTPKSKYGVKIATKSLNDGVASITLFDADGHPVAERLVFIDNPENNLKVDVKTPKQAPTSRKKVTLQLNVTDINGINKPSSLSMAVRDLKAFPYNSRNQNIKTWLLLNSDLKGKVKNAGYFFEKENDNKRRYLLDLVMMTNGWRQFTWQQLLTGTNNSTTFAVEKGLFISGTTKQLKKPYTAKSSPTRLTFFGENIIQEPIQQSDSLGHFKFGPYVFFDSIPVLIESRMEDFKSKKRKSRNIVILLDPPYHKTPIKKDTLKTNLVDKKTANFFKVTQYLQEVKFKYNSEIEKLATIEITAKRKTEQEKRMAKMDSRTLYGSPMSSSDRIDVNSDITGPEIYNAFELLDRFSGISIYGDSVYVRRERNMPSILLDGMQVDVDLLKTINGDEISFIDLLTGGEAMLFSTNGSSVIALYSNTGHVSNKNITRKPGIIDFKAQGFYTARKFYAPDHINGFEEVNKSDVRTTLHWKPQLRTTSTKSTEVSFFTSDIKSDYIIEIEGISDTGIPIHATQTFYVN